MTVRRITNRHELFNETDLKLHTHCLLKTGILRPSVFKMSPVSQRQFNEEKKKKDLSCVAIV